MRAHADRNRTYRHRIRITSAPISFAFHFAQNRGVGPRSTRRRATRGAGNRDVRSRYAVFANLTDGGAVLLRSCHRARTRVAEARDVSDHRARRRSARRTSAMRSTPRDRARRASFASTWIARRNPHSVFRPPASDARRRRRRPSRRTPRAARSIRAFASVFAAAMIVVRAQRWVRGATDRRRTNERSLAPRPDRPTRVD